MGGGGYKLLFSHLPFLASILTRVVKNIVTSYCFSCKLDLQNGVPHYGDVSYFLGSRAPPLPPRVKFRKFHSWTKIALVTNLNWFPWTESEYFLFFLFAYLILPLGCFRSNTSSLRYQRTIHIYLTVHFEISTELSSRSKRHKVICFGGQPTNQLNNKTGPPSYDVMLTAASRTWLCSNTKKSVAFSALLLNLLLKT